MASSIMLYAGSVILIVWGIAHIVMTKPVINGFEPLSKDNRQVITMEWITEGLALCFIGLLVLFITIFEVPQNSVSIFVYRSSALMLIIMAVLSAFTGARTPHLPYKLCPPIFTTAAILFFVATLL